MERIDVHDRLEPLGVFVGVALVLGAAGTLLGAPWATSGSVLATVLQLVGVAAMIALGVGLARLSYVGDSD